ncbi:MAG: 30S ribosomal protein S15 [Bdellovibrionales bacterium]|nr:30S ribosomal protein S15 [Bdellovibrionales bacterium]
MTLTVEDKTALVQKFGTHEGDTGSPRVQVALITARLNYLQQHFSSHAKDHHSRRGLLKMVGRRRRLLDYIKDRDVQEYRQLIQDLGIRK